MSALAGERTLSVLVVSKNEAAHIGASLVSIREAAQRVPGTEIILVDSGSTDSTLTIAERFPIRILQLMDSRLASASAGFFIGAGQAAGKYLQFIGADTILDVEWLEMAVTFLETHPEIAGVRGILAQAPYPNPLARMQERAMNGYCPKDSGETTIFGGGVLMLRRQSLLDAGNFNPWLRSEEDIELNERMIRDGTRFWYLNVPMALHMGYSTFRRGDLLRKMTRYKSGYGQLLRIRLAREPSVWGRLKPLYTALRGPVFVGLELAGLAAGFWVGNWLPLEVTLLALLGALAYKIAKHRSLRNAGAFVRDLHIEWPFLLRGFLKRPHHPSEFPQEVRAVGKGGT